MAVVLGLVGSTNPTYFLILVVIGLIIGLLNISDREVNSFLMSGVVLIIASAFGQDALSSVPIFLTNIFQALLAIFVPAVIIVAIKNMFTLAKD